MSECFNRAKEIYAALGVDVESAISRLNEIPVSLHCWQVTTLPDLKMPEPLTGGLLLPATIPAERAMRKNCAMIYLKF